MLTGENDSSASMCPPYDLSLADRNTFDVEAVDATDLVKRFLVCQTELRPAPSYSLPETADIMSDTLAEASGRCGDCRPVFLIQDPIRVVDTWKEAGQTDVDDLIIAFDIALGHILKGPPPHTVSCLLYERFIRNPEKGMEHICAHWNMPYWAGMLDSQRPSEAHVNSPSQSIRDLGIAGFVDFLATTNHFGVSKVDGLFPRVLEHLGISPSEMAYVGDNELRDMKPAMTHGAFCVHLAEAEHVALDASPPRINTLRKLQYILSGKCS